MASLALWPLCVALIWLTSPSWILLVAALPLVLMLSLLDVFFKPLRTVKSILPKLRLGFSTMFLQALYMVLACPSDEFAWVQLLILPCCVLGTFLPKKESERRSGMRERCQFDSISNVVSRWRDPSNRLRLVLDRLVEVRPPIANAKKVYNLEQSDLY